MSYAIRIEQFPGQTLAVVRRQATKQQLGQVIPQACGAVWSGLKQQQIKGAGRHVAVYLDAVFNLEIGVEINPRSNPSARSPPHHFPPARLPPPRTSAPIRFSATPTTRSSNGALRTVAKQPGRAGKSMGTGSMNGTNMRPRFGRMCIIS